MLLSVLLKGFLTIKNPQQPLNRDISQQENIIPPLTNNPTLIQRFLRQLAVSFITQSQFDNPLIV